MSSGMMAMRCIFCISARTFDPSLPDATKDFDESLRTDQFYESSMVATKGAKVTKQTVDACDCSSW